MIEMTKSIDNQYCTKSARFDHTFVFPQGLHNFNVEGVWKFGSKWIIERFSKLPNELALLRLSADTLFHQVVKFPAFDFEYQDA